MAPVLGYWKMRGLAQPIRYILRYAQVEHTERQYVIGPAPDYDCSDWTNEKFNLGMDFPNIPYYFDGERKITESNAVRRHLARKYDLYGTTEDDRIRIDMASGVIEEIDRNMYPIVYPDAEGPEYDSKRAEFIKNIDEPLKKLSKLVENKKFIIGDKVSFVDFMLLDTMEQHELLVPACTSSYPSLTAFFQRVTQLPSIKAYRESTAFTSLRCNTPYASVNN